MPEQQHKALEPLTPEQVDQMIHARHVDKTYIPDLSMQVALNWYRMGVRDCEEAHGIRPEHPTAPSVRAAITKEHA